MDQPGDRRFRDYVRRCDWVQKHIFPGAELASIAEVLQSLARVTRLQLHHAEEIGMHYSYTLRAWRERFLAVLPQVRALGFDERFIRMWDIYLASCEAALAERSIGDIQLLLTKAGTRARMLGEPWPEKEEEPVQEYTNFGRMPEENPFPPAKATVQEGPR